MDISDLFRLNRPILEEKKEAIRQIEMQLSILSENAKAGRFLEIITSALYEAHAIDSKTTIKEVFFDFNAAIKKTRQRREYIEVELSEILLVEDPSIEKLRVAKLYRDIVADIFDPYISLIVACLQIKEGTFESFVVSNLGQGERNKYEYAISRLKPTTLFDGYSPIVRNALSHTGSESIIIQDDIIVFRSIKRGNPPTIELVKWSIDELYQKIALLMDFIHSIEISVNIYGLDIGDEIVADTTLKDSFFTKVLEKDDRLYIQEGFDSLINNVMADETGLKEKLDSISALYFLECTKREMPVLSLKYNEDDRIILIDIPADQYDPLDDDAIVKQVTTMIRYGIVAEPCFRHSFDHFVVQETMQGSTNQIKIRLLRQDLFDYGQENAGVLDLINSCRTLLNNRVINIAVDFEKAKELELLSFDMIFPRRAR